MKWSSKAVLSAALAAPALAADMSLCDMYTTALLKNNTAANQYTLLTLVVNTAVIGNYTTPNVGIKVNGILVPGEYNGKQINLLPYFNGGLVSTNRNGTAVSLNFIDGGGAIPLAMNMPADTDKQSSNQYKLLTHLYQYFGALLGCSHYGEMGFPAYAGSAKMYEVHKHMNLDPDEMNYFITQVGLSAASFGVSEQNVTYIANALNSTFNMKCSPPVAVLPSAVADLQAMCINSACPVAPSPVCSKYNKNNGNGVDPMTATSTPGPQLTALAAQLSSISAGSATMMTGSMTSGSMTGSSSSMMMSSIETTTSVATTITSVETSGSSTITNVITTSTGVATTIAASSAPGNAAPLQTAALGMMAVAGAAGVIGQML